MSSVREVGGAGRTGDMKAQRELLEMKENRAGQEGWGSRGSHRTRNQTVRENAIAAPTALHAN